MRQMVFAVYFYDKSVFQRHEISDVCTNNMLPPEVNTKLSAS